MPAPNATATPSLIETLDAYIEGVPEAERADALHQVFYGFYTRVAIIDRTTHDLAAAARDAPPLDDLADSLAEALRDNALFVGQELFASRVRAMSAMGYVSGRLAERVAADPAAVAGGFTLTHAVAFDEESGALKTYDLSQPGEHPDLPYDAASYDPRGG